MPGRVLCVRVSHVGIVVGAPASGGIARPFFDALISGRRFFEQVAGGHGCGRGHEDREMDYGETSKLLHRVNHEYRGMGSKYVTWQRLCYSECAAVVSRL